VVLRKTMSKQLRISPQTTPLRGTVTVPGDKSISHRAIMLAAIAEGSSTVRDWLPAGDTLATLEAFQALGVQIEIEKKSSTAWDLMIEGRGLRGLEPPNAAIDCRNAGTGMRLLAGILAGQPFSSIVDGSDQLRQRPMTRITDPLQAYHTRATARHFPQNEGSQCPGQKRHLAGWLICQWRHTCLSTWACP
jgi:3-phosphoshikimate 1-carboxyvinyltransferase